VISQHDLRLMVQVARLYYEDDRTQEEIATALGLSRPKVSRLLQQARQEGIVQICIIDPSSNHAQLENALVERFGLAVAVVVPGERGSPELVRRRIGQRAARYLESTLRDGDVVGIGWGRTLHAMVASLQVTRTTRISVVPLIGGLGGISPSFQIHELARMLAEAFGGTWQSFYAPAIMQDEESWNRLMCSTDATRIAEDWERMNLALVGIGNVGFETDMQMLFADYLDRETQERLKVARAVGDICMRFFDLQGCPCPDVLRGVVGIGLPRLQKVHRVVGVAGGPGKAEAILGALRGRFINVLVTDETAAQQVLELAA